MREPKHKKLVNAIVDSITGTHAIATKTEKQALTLAGRLNLAVRNLIQARVTGKISVDTARKLYSQMYTNLMLVGFVDVAQEVADHGESSHSAIHGAARELGPEVHKVQAIRKPDVLAREIEKQNGT